MTLNRKAARRLAAVAGTCWLIVSVSGHAAEGPRWVVRPGSVACSDYFALKDGEAALSAGDRNWLADLGCFAATEPLGIQAIIDGNQNEPSGAWRVRISGASGNSTVYLRGRDVVTSMPGGKWQTMPCLHGGGWRCD